MMTKKEAKLFIDAIVALRNSATDEQALNAVCLYPAWKENKIYEAGNRVMYNDVLYKVLSTHTSQSDLAPDVAVRLFAKVLVKDENVISE